ncbi:hypothetical protein THASP1DRAFT_22353 [Thamnocephalis sphaerospora]|uniref:Uncharacterized protein n=1 Tax=Thamnocephalis sphaerospora TaxID=78915 RepID=A0A4P9XUG0_9FUNG|nr:hypothetical protein THASP1DRAFT_22353 [Thamnocephalis sphaerospora]|eukprot:RKP09867.1 hypothetical protein THASP1DRAFT_22353 [Thamnocephalis sphaerospora]
MYLATRNEVLIQLGHAWKQNATYFGSIPLHPLGEQSFYQFMLNSENAVDERARMIVVLRQHMIDVLVALLFAWNLVVSLRMLYRRPRVIATTCCLVQSVAGLLCAMTALATFHPDGPSCRVMVWTTTAAVRTGDLCVSIVLLQKAYLVTNRNRWLFVFIPLIVTAGPVLLYVSWSSPAIVTAGSGCIFVYPEYFPWLRFGFHAPMNIMLTGIFLDVAFQHWRQFGSDCWRQLARDGIQVGLIMPLPNLVCTFAIALEVVGIYSIMVLLVDWCVSSFLLVAHVNSMGQQANTAGCKMGKTSAPQLLIL